MKKLGGSGTNDEICNQIILDLNLTDDVVDYPHKDDGVQSELQYRLAWARTYMKKFGVIENSVRGVWAITAAFASETKLDERNITRTVRENAVNSAAVKNTSCQGDSSDTLPSDNDPTNDNTEFPDENKPWRTRLAEVLATMDPYGFERLSQRLLRECGFSQVEVTKKSGDGGIDGTGKLRINGIFSFNVAFQCKRYKGLVSASDIRDFRGSLTTDIEKGVMITTGSFSKAAREEASNAGKQQIDLIDGEEFISKLAEFSIGVHEIKDYEIDEEYFHKI